jgi:hypothetical protein
MHHVYQKPPIPSRIDTTAHLRQQRQAKDTEYRDPRSTWTPLHLDSERPLMTSVHLEAAWCKMLCKVDITHSSLSTMHCIHAEGLWKRSRRILQQHKVRI